MSTNLIQRHPKTRNPIQRLQDVPQQTGTADRVFRMVRNAGGTLPWDNDLDEGGSGLKLTLPRLLLQSLSKGESVGNPRRLPKRMCLRGHYSSELQSRVVTQWARKRSGW